MIRRADTVNQYVLWHRCCDESKVSMRNKNEFSEDVWKIVRGTKMWKVLEIV